jgi:prevent-host-death family protein
MPVINTHEAKTHLSQLLEDVKEGKEIIIGKFGVPIAKLVPFTAPHTKRTGGQLKGKIVVSRDFDVLPKSFLKHFTRS